MYKHIKRIFDILISSILIPFVVLTTIFIAPLIILDDKGPVFYSSKRLGYNGKVFKMLKFRSMKINSLDLRNEDGSTFNSPDDVRVTRIGAFLRKTSLDEIPQIFNVFLGNMSLIGPRPDLPEHFDYYTDVELLKLKVKPGITGLNQAYFRNSIPWKKRLANDVEYANKLSFWLDIRILFKTIIIVFRKEKIYTSESSNE